MTASYQAREQCPYPSRQALEDALEAEERRTAESVPPPCGAATLHALPGAADGGEYGEPAA
jgi:hypothetical protein